MLKALTIQDLAVVRHLDVEFEAGLTILTGETGAGKSILIEALGLTLGDRADTSMVRAKAERASVSATFDITDNAVLQVFLADHDLADGTECILRRVLSADGRSRAFCNAIPVPVQILKQIGELIVDIHGQHAHHSLLRRAVMRESLDEFGQCAGQAKAVAAAFTTYRELQRELARLSNGADDVASRIDLLRFQSEELDNENINSEKLSNLENEHRRIAHAAKITEACDDVESLAFSGDTAALSATIKAAGRLREVSALDDALSGVGDLFDQAIINLQEAERELHHLRSNINADPAHLAALDAQLQTIQDLSRKHRCEAHELPARLESIRDELEELSGREELIKQINTDIEAAEKTYAKAAAALHKRRTSAAAKMNKEITRRIRELGITHGEFKVAVERTKDAPSVHGDDDIEFLVTANPDQPLRPMKKVASGGELSRISLAIQVATTGTSGIPVLVFDEVDTGIGGPTADVVSRYLSDLSQRRQILCITHLPQVASAGEHHLSIGKMVVGGITETTIRNLDADDRIEEIARMLGGERITKKAREHARELLTS